MTQTDTDNDSDVDNVFVVAADSVAPIQEKTTVPGLTAPGVTKSTEKDEKLAEKEEGEEEDVSPPLQIDNNNVVENGLLESPRKSKKKKKKNKKKKRKRQSSESESDEESERLGKKEWEKLYYEFQSVYYEKHGEYYSGKDSKYIEKYHKKHFTAKVESPSPEVDEAENEPPPEMTKHEPAAREEEVETPPDEGVPILFGASNTVSIPPPLFPSKLLPPGPSMMTSMPVMPNLTPARPQFNPLSQPPAPQPPQIPGNWMPNGMPPPFMPPMPIFPNSAVLPPGMLPNFLPGFPPVLPQNERKSFMPQFPNFEAQPPRSIPPTNVPSMTNDFSNNRFPLDSSMKENPPDNRFESPEFQEPNGRRALPFNDRMNSFENHSREKQVYRRNKESSRWEDRDFDRDRDAYRNQKLDNGFNSPNNGKRKRPSRFGRDNGYDAFEEEIEKKQVLEDLEQATEKIKAAMLARVLDKDSFNTSRESPKREQVESPYHCYYEEISSNLYKAGMWDNNSKLDDPLTSSALTQSGADRLQKQLFILAEDTDENPHGIFQSGSMIETDVFQTEKKGMGLRTLQSIDSGVFVTEFVGEVLRDLEIPQRLAEYRRKGLKHDYMMILDNKRVLDATTKGNKSRFMNHSCAPNCEIQRWSVGGFTRLAVVAIADISPGAELTFDYRHETYGRVVPNCFCENDNCCGSIDSKVEKYLAYYKEGFEYSRLQNEMDILLQNCGNFGLQKSCHVSQLVRAMRKLDDVNLQDSALRLLLSTKDLQSLEDFVKLFGLSILENWMMEHKGRGNFETLTRCLKVLLKLPLNNRDQIEENGLLSLVESLAQEFNPDGFAEKVNESSNKRSEISGSNGADDSFLTANDKDDNLPAKGTLIPLKKKILLEHLSESDVKVEPESSQSKNGPTDANESGEILNDSCASDNKDYYSFDDGEIVSEEDWKAVAGKLATELFFKWMQLPSLFTGPVKIEVKKRSSSVSSDSNLRPGNSSLRSESESDDKILKSGSIADGSLKRRLSSSSEETYGKRVDTRDRSPIQMPAQKVTKSNELYFESNEILQNSSGESCGDPKASEPASETNSDSNGSFVFEQPVTPPSQNVPSSNGSSDDPKNASTNSNGPVVLQPGQVIYVQTEHGLVPQQIGMPPPSETLSNSEDSFTENSNHLEDSNQAEEELSPKKKLPPNWRCATDAEGSVYYYHRKTRETQWEFPEAREDDDEEEESESEEEAEEDVRSDSSRAVVVRTPPVEEKTIHRPVSALKHRAKPSTESSSARTNEDFRQQVSKLVVQCLNGYMRSDCRAGRITSAEDFKYVARKISHFIVSKELARAAKDRSGKVKMNEAIAKKVKTYIKSYMCSVGPVYKKHSAKSPK